VTKHINLFQKYLEKSAALNPEQEKAIQKILAHYIKSARDSVTYLIVSTDHLQLEKIGKARFVALKVFLDKIIPFEKKALILPQPQNCRENTEQHAFLSRQLDIQSRTMRLNKEKSSQQQARLSNTDSNDYEKLTDETNKNYTIDVYVKLIKESDDSCMRRTLF
jgi:hypothetical protein